MTKRLRLRRPGKAWRVGDVYWSAYGGLHHDTDDFIGPIRRTLAEAREDARVWLAELDRSARRTAWAACVAYLVHSVGEDGQPDSAEGIRSVTVR